MKINKNAKVEQLTNFFLSREEEKGLTVKDPLNLSSVKDEGQFRVPFGRICFKNGTISGELTQFKA